MTGDVTLSPELPHFIRSAVEDILREHGEVIFDNLEGKATIYSLTEKDWDERFPGHQLASAVAEQGDIFLRTAYWNLARRCLLNWEDHLAHVLYHEVLHLVGHKDGDKSIEEKELAFVKTRLHGRSVRIINSDIEDYARKTQRGR